MPSLGIWGVGAGTAALFVRPMPLPVEVSLFSTLLAASFRDPTREEGIACLRAPCECQAH
jgi:hypothetical protein